MTDAAGRLARVLDGLEAFHGRVRTARATDPYELLLRANCGYPASEKTTRAGFAALKAAVGTAPRAIVRARRATLVEAMRAGGIVPELRATRVRDVAQKTLGAGGDLRRALKGGTPAAARTLLKSFPTIADPGADRVLLLAHVEPIAAVPSNATQVPVRLGFGAEGASYAATYRGVQRVLDEALPRTFDARIRAYALLKLHGETVCKRTKPACDRCPVAAECPYFASLRRSQ
jgi:endonuclease III